MKKLSEVIPNWNPSSASAAGSTDSSWTDEFEEGADCPVCRGARFVRRSVPLGHPEFGQAVPCCCVDDEVDTDRHGRLLRYSNLGSLVRLTFDNLVPRGRSSVQQDQEIFERCVAASRAFAEEPHGWIVMAGASGSGKTHIAAAIANRSVALGRPALFTVVPDLLDHLRSAYRPDTELGYDALFAQVRDAPVLILDDLGTHNTTPWAEEKLFQLLNHRFNGRLPTVITTGARLHELNERIRTRLTDPAVVKLFFLEEMESPGHRELGSVRYPLLQAMTFRSFQVQPPNVSEDGRASLERAFQSALRFAESPQGWLTFLGGHGAGKTHLAAAIANQVQAKGGAPLFFAVADLLDLLRAGLADGAAVPYEALFERVRSVPVLVLDDLVAAEGNNWGREKLYQLLNYRYNALLPTVITSSLTLDEVDERVASRLLDPKVGEVIRLQATDYRGEIRRAAPAADGASRGKGEGPGRRGRGRRE
jgi:DNA replication protein DnaC